MGCRADRATVAEPEEDIMTIIAIARVAALGSTAALPLV